MRRSGSFAAVNGLYWLMLGLWIGSLVLAGAAAAIVFPLMKGLNPTIPEFEAYSGSHALLLGGKIMSRIFTAQDLIELLAVVVIAIILVLHFTVFRLSMRTLANSTRIVSAAILLAIVSYKTFVLGPRMYYHLRQYWDAARAGDLEAASVARDAFDADHPTATTLMVISLGGLVVLTFASAAALSGVVVEGSAQAPPRSGATQLQEPALLRRMNR